ncbi:MAG TPA: glucosamine-6-phosphate deaminase [Streptosporangiales bacterium]
MTASHVQEPVATRTVEGLRVVVHADRSATGRAAGAEVARAIRDAQERQERVRVMFASAPSQQDMLAALGSAEGIDWRRVTAFHMDEYVGLPADAPQRFGPFLVEHLFRAVRPGEVHLIEPDEDAAAECERYAALIREAPLDVVCLGIGENGHLAFNDPPDADFADPAVVKVVELSETSRRQQVNDGCFDRLADVPGSAVTVTVPALLAGRRLVCTVVGASKRDAVHRALTGPVDASCPASALRTHADATLYLDAAAASPEDDHA